MPRPPSPSPTIAAATASVEADVVIAAAGGARAHRPRPFRGYPGGKDAAGSGERIVGRFPPHSLYVSAFLGGGADVRRKTPALRTIGIDEDAGVIDRWRAARWPGLELVCADAIAWLERAAAWLPADALVYADPPYPLGTRSGRRLYRRELTDADHARLLEALDALPCSVVVSSYDNPLYRRRLREWESDHWRAMTRGGVRVEWIWWRRSSNARYGEETRYVGRDFRERERLKRKVARWCAKLDAMPPAERALVLGACIARYAEAAGPSDPAMVDRHGPTPRPSPKPASGPTRRI